MTKIALITGASRGLGYALGEALSTDFHIVAVGRTTGGLEDLDDAIKARGGAASLAPMDITTDAAMQQLCRSIHERWGRLDLWIHSAIHATPLAQAQDIAAKDLDKALAVNVAATARLIQYLTPLLGREGRAVFFEDTQIGSALWGAYGASKAAQMALARSWAEESARTGPEIRILAPRPMLTATRARFYPSQAAPEAAHPREEAARLLPQILAPAADS